MKMVRFHFLPGQENPADILSKHWGYQQIWKMLRGILFWRGDTGDLIEEEEDDPQDRRKGSDTGSVLNGDNPSP